MGEAHVCCSARGLWDFNWGFGKGLLSLVPQELPPAVWGRGRNGFPWECTGAPPDLKSEAPRGLLEERGGGGRGGGGAVSSYRHKHMQANLCSRLFYTDICA